MGFVDRMRQSIHPFTPHDRNDVMEFRRQTLGDHPRQCSERCFDWAFGRNAHRDEGPAELWICRRGGRIVGQQAGLPCLLKVGGTLQRASWAVDLLVAPEWRLRGVGPCLMDAQAGHSPIALALGVGDMAYPSYLRQGWFDVGPVPTYVWPLRPSQLVTFAPARYARLAPAARIADPAAGAACALLSRLCALMPGTFVPIGAFDRRVDRVWDAVAPHIPLIAQRNADTLRWRFDEIPDHDDHHRFYLMADGEVVGYAVLRFDRWRGRTFGLVIDYLAPNARIPALFGHCLRAAQRMGAAALVCKTLNQGADLRLRSLGFIRTERKPFWPTRFMVHLPDDREALSESMRDPSRWFITMADSDIGLDHLDWRDPPEPAG